MMLCLGLAQDVPRWVNSTNARPNWFLIFASGGQRVTKGKEPLTVRLRIYSQFHHLSNLKFYAIATKLFSKQIPSCAHPMTISLMIGFEANEISITYPLSISVEESSLRKNFTKTMMVDYMTQMLNTLTIRIPLDTHDWL